MNVLGALTQGDRSPTVLNLGEHNLITEKIARLHPGKRYKVETFHRNGSAYREKSTGKDEWLTHGDLMTKRLELFDWGFETIVTDKEGNEVLHYYGVHLPKSRVPDLLNDVGKKAFTVH